MKIHALQTGTVQVKQFQISGAPHKLSRIYQLLFTNNWSKKMPIYSWLIEQEDGLVLVDTGETAKIYEEGYLPKGGVYHKAVQTFIQPEEEIQYQLDKLGFSPQDIKTVVLTHLHGDHIGGLAHFSHSRILVSRQEYEFATSNKGESNGYFQKNWPTWFKPELVDYQNEKEGIFNTSYRLDAKENIVIVPTPGHSIGHQSVIAKGQKKSFFIGGDLTYNQTTLEQEIPNIVMINKTAKETVKRVKTYVKQEDAVYLSSHDWGVPQLLK